MSFMPFIEDRLFLRIEREDFEIFNVNNGQKEDDKEDKSPFPIEGKTKVNIEPPLLENLEQELNAESNEFQKERTRLKESEEESVDQEDKNEGGYSQETTTAKVDYNIEEELALIACNFESCETHRIHLYEVDHCRPNLYNSNHKPDGMEEDSENVSGAPGFTNNGPKDEPAHLAADTEIENEADQSFSNPIRRKYRGRPKKNIDLAPSKKKKAPAPSKQNADSSSGDFINNEEEEAQAT
ncbi:hypothetical protein RIF29_09590 [Crotalaria pallida]|uniref:Uncharacterized protein n=1 Tax=Crotalaria pallida TaxID=3830 RepID=A0AAN9FUJ9_CROPI